MMLRKLSLALLLLPLPALADPDPSWAKIKVVLPAVLPNPIPRNFCDGYPGTGTGERDAPFYQCWRLIQDRTQPGGSAAVEARTKALLAPQTSEAEQEAVARAYAKKTAGWPDAEENQRRLDQGCILLNKSAAAAINCMEP